MAVTCGVKRPQHSPNILEDEMLDEYDLIDKVAAITVTIAVCLITIIALAVIYGD
jgi:hypothetical protein